jgi:membrane protein
MKRAFSFIKETFSDWSEDRASRLAAALAYYTIFSVAPLLVLIIAIAGFVLRQQSVENQVLSQASSVVGQQGASLLRTMINHMQQGNSGIIATVLGVVAVLVGATGVFAALQDSLNTIWEVQPKPGQGIWVIVRQRVVSFLIVLGIGLLLLASLVATAVLSGISQFISGASGISVTGQVINIVVSLVVITLLFAVIYKVLPDVQISWKDMWVGAGVTAILFVIGRFLIGLYLAHSTVASAYGAAGSLVILLIWIYYSAQILFLGAEFTQVYAKRYGTRIRPDDIAEPATAEMRAQQGMPPRNKKSPVIGGRQSQAPQPAAASSEPAVSNAPASHTPVTQISPSAERQRAFAYSAARGTQPGFHLSGLALAGIVLGVLAGFAQFGGTKKKPVRR